MRMLLLWSCCSVDTNKFETAALQANNTLPTQTLLGVRAPCCIWHHSTHKTSVYMVPLLTLSPTCPLKGDDGLVSICRSDGLGVRVPTGRPGGLLLLGTARAGVRLVSCIRAAANGRLTHGQSCSVSTALQSQSVEVPGCVAHMTSRSLLGSTCLLPYARRKCRTCSLQQLVNPCCQLVQRLCVLGGRGLQHVGVLCCPELPHPVNCTAPTHV